jgi:hypothetical protein
MRYAAARLILFLLFVNFLSTLVLAGCAVLLLGMRRLMLSKREKKS